MVVGGTGRHFLDDDAQADLGGWGAEKVALASLRQLSAAVLRDDKVALLAIPQRFEDGFLDQDRWQLLIRLIEWGATI